MAILKCDPSQLNNPSHGIFEISFDTEVPQLTTYEVYDVLGKKILHETIHKGVKNSFVNLENYPQGVYLLHIIIGNTILNKKLIKE